jgi:archaellum component FlaC
MREGTFCQFRKKLEGEKQEKPSSIQDQTGEAIEEKKKILEAYKEFYNKLFEKEKSTTINGQQEKKRMAKKMEEIQNIAKHQEPIQFEYNEITKGINQLKKKKAADLQGWRNEMILNGGPEMEKSLMQIYNAVLRGNKVPEEWEQVKIKSIYKNKGSRKQLKNRRGLFITSIISKLFEKVLMEKLRSMNTNAEERREGLLKTIG